MAREILLSLKAQLRVPIAVFFSIFFPIIMMIMMMTSYGNFSLRNGYHFIDKYFFISTTIGILPLTLISFPIDINNLLETKHYLRLKYLNVDLKKLFLSNIISYLIIVFISVGINLIVGKSIYNLRLPSIEYLCYFFYSIILLCDSSTYIWLTVKFNSIRYQSFNACRNDYNVYIIYGYRCFCTV